MNVSVEQLAPCKVLVKVEIDAAAVDAAFDRATTEFQKQARLTGFRPGKAPVYLVSRTYEKEIEQEVRRRLFSDNYKAALKDHNLRPLGNPDIEEIQFGRGKGYQFALRGPG